MVEQDPQGRRIPQGYSRLEPAVRGNDLILSLDQSLQYELERALVDAVGAATAKGGLAIVADTRTGGILAMANVTGDGAGAARPSAARRAQPGRHRRLRARLDQQGHHHGRGASRTGW